MAKLPPISIQTQDGAPPKTDLATPLRKILQLLKIKDCRWSILLVSDQEMKKLHRRYLNNPATTDVLTFDMREGAPPSTVHLDTVLCLDEARRRAAELGQSVDHELLLYAVHSLLHVQGHNDLTPTQAARMHRREDELLAQIGIGPVYHKQASRPGNRKSKIKNRESPRRRP